MIVNDQQVLHVILIQWSRHSDRDIISSKNREHLGALHASVKACQNSCESFFEICGVLLTAHNQALDSSEASSLDSLVQCVRLQCRQDRKKIECSHSLPSQKSHYVPLQILTTQKPVAPLSGASALEEIILSYSAISACFLQYVIAKA